MAARRWSQDVTERSNALDLQARRVRAGRPKGDRSFVEAVGARKPSAQEFAVPVGDVDVDVLYQPRR